MQDKDAYIKHLENTIKDLQNQIANLTEIIMLLRKEKFGSSSEKTPKKQADNQLSLFNEAEIEVNDSVSEPITADAKGYKYKDMKTKREKLIKDLPIKEVSCTLYDEGQLCSQCNTPLKILGKQTVREELEYIPAKLQIVRYVQTVYECPKCKHTAYPFLCIKNM